MLEEAAGQVLEHTNIIDGDIDAWWLGRKGGAADVTFECDGQTVASQAKVSEVRV
jgi:hypothetical protein